MAGGIASLFGMKPKAANIVIAPSTAQQQAAADQSAAIAAQEATAAKNEATAAASARARGASGRALLLNDEVGVPNSGTLQKTLGS